MQRNSRMRGVARKRSFDRTVVKKCPKCEQQVGHMYFQIHNFKIIVEDFRENSDSVLCSDSPVKQ